MKVLITGGAGSVGSYIVPRLSKKGWRVRVLDKNIDIFKEKDNEIELIRGEIKEIEKVNQATKDSDVIVHLAWSFSDDPFDLLEVDLKGLLYLLDSSVKNKVKQFIFISSAVVYGSPKYTPIDEVHPREVEDSRKPAYAWAKLAAEKLCLLYQKEHNLPVTNVRFWWGFGEEISGRHLREMIKQALNNETIQVPKDAGGSFLLFEDFLMGIERMMLNNKAFGETFNLSSFYITWEDIAKMIVGLAGSGQVETIPQTEWKGSSFLADVWDLSYKRAADILAFRPMHPEAEAKRLLKKAIRNCKEKMQKARAA